MIQGRKKSLIGLVIFCLLASLFLFQNCANLKLEKYSSLLSVGPTPLPHNLPDQSSPTATPEPTAQASGTPQDLPHVEDCPHETCYSTNPPAHGGGFGWEAQSGDAGLPLVIWDYIGENSSGAGYFAGTGMFLSMQHGPVTSGTSGGYLSGGFYSQAPNEFMTMRNFGWDSSILPPTGTAPNKNPKLNFTLPLLRLSEASGTTVMVSPQVNLAGELGNVVTTAPTIYRLTRNTDGTPGVDWIATINKCSPDSTACLQGPYSGNAIPVGNKIILVKGTYDQVLKRTISTNEFFSYDSNGIPTKIGSPQIAEKPVGVLPTTPYVPLFSIKNVLIAATFAGPSDRTAYLTAYRVQNDPFTITRIKELATYSDSAAFILGNYMMSGYNFGFSIDPGGEYFTWCLSQKCDLWKYTGSGSTADVQNVLTIPPDRPTDLNRSLKVALPYFVEFVQSNGRNSVFRVMQLNGTNLTQKSSETLPDWGVRADGSTCLVIPIEPSCVKFSGNYSPLTIAAMALGPAGEISIVTGVRPYVFRMRIRP